MISMCVHPLPKAHFAEALTWLKSWLVTQPCVHPTPGLSAATLASEATATVACHPPYRAACQCMACPCRLTQPAKALPGAWWHNLQA